MGIRSVIRYVITAMVLAIIASETTPAQTIAPSAPTLSPSAPTSSTKPTHESDKLVFAIASIHVDTNRNQLIIEYAIQNVDKFRKYLMLYGSSAASVDSGASGLVDNSSMQGIAHCFFYSSGDTDSLRECGNAQSGTNENGGDTNLQNYTYIEPGDLAAARIAYYFQQGQLGQAQSANFSFMAIVRTSNSTDNSLEDSSGSAGVGPKQIVNVNFPFVPIQQPSN